MPVSRATKNPRVIWPQTQDLRFRGAEYRVAAYPLIKAQAKGHPFRGKAVIDITEFVEELSWSGAAEEMGVVSCSITLRNPKNILGILIPGSKIRIYAPTPFSLPKNAAPKRLPYLDILIVERDKRVVEATVELLCYDRMYFLTLGTGTYNYPKAGKWTASKIILDRLRKDGIPFKASDIARTGLVFDTDTNYDGVSQLQLFTNVLQKHNNLTGRRRGYKAIQNWEMHMRFGTFYCKPHAPPAKVWGFDRRMVGDPSYKESATDIITEVVLHYILKSEKANTTVDGGYTTTGAKGHSYVYPEVRPTLLQRIFGRIVYSPTLDGTSLDRQTFDNHRQARAYARYLYEKMGRVKRFMTINVQALHGVWVGKKIYVGLKQDYGISGFFTVTSFNYRLSGASGFTMDVTIDAGNILMSHESKLPIKVANAQVMSNRRTVRVFYSDGNFQDVEGKKAVRSFQVVKATDVVENDVLTRGETVEISYVDGSTGVVPNRFEQDRDFDTDVEDSFSQAQGVDERTWVVE